MDGIQFDIFTRTLGRASSRRAALRGLLVGTVSLLGWSGTQNAAAKNCKKIKNKKKRKKCLAQANAVTPSPTCTPTCAATTPCGPDGCAGSCGSCPVGRVCNGGTCGCPSGQALCGDACVTACSSDSVLDPTCQCCMREGSQCDTDSQCCSDDCDGGGGVLKFCIGHGAGALCQFNEQCSSRLCTNGTCGCPSGSVACGGLCLDPCPDDKFYVPGACSCCLDNGASCEGTTDTRCCAGSNRCLGNTCVGRDDGASCEFSYECADSPCIGRICGGQFG